jgi:TolA-binding protein
MATRETTTPATEAAHGHDDLAQTKALVDQYWKPLVAAACVMAIGGSGIVIYRVHTQGQTRDAAAQLGQAQSAQHLQDLLETYPEAPTAPSALIRLAKEYYDTLNFAKAEEAYNRFLAEYPQHLWAPTASLGLVHCKEARAGGTEQALAGYQEFAAAHKDHFLYAQAVLGQTRCYEQLGKLAEAKAVCEDFIATRDEDAWGPVLEATLNDLDMKLKRRQGAL